MNPTTNNVLQEYKQCAGKNCQRAGIHSLKVRYLNKKDGSASRVKIGWYLKGLSKQIAIQKRDVCE